MENSNAKYLLKLHHEATNYFHTFVDVAKDPDDVKRKFTEKERDVAEDIFGKLYDVREDDYKDYEKMLKFMEEVEKILDEHIEHKYGNDTSYLGYKQFFHLIERKLKRFIKKNKEILDN